MRRHLARLLWRLGRWVDPDRRWVYANMLGNATQELPVARGRFTEYATDPNVRFDQLRQAIDKAADDIEADLNAYSAAVDRLAEGLNDRCEAEQAVSALTAAGLTYGEIVEHADELAASFGRLRGDDAA